MYMFCSKPQAFFQGLDAKVFFASCFIFVLDFLGKVRGANPID